MSGWSKIGFMSIKGTLKRWFFGRLIIFGSGPLVNFGGSSVQIKLGDIMQNWGRYYVHETMIRHTLHNANSCNHFFLWFLEFFQAEKIVLCLQCSQGKVHTPLIFFGPYWFLWIKIYVSSCPIIQQKSFCALHSSSFNMYPQGLDTECMRAFVTEIIEFGKDQTNKIQNRSPNYFCCPPKNNFCTPYCPQIFIYWRFL